MENCTNINLALELEWYPYSDIYYDAEEATKNENLHDIKFRNSCYSDSWELLHKVSTIGEIKMTSKSLIIRDMELAN
jgi:hypothetical protein